MISNLLNNLNNQTNNNFECIIVDSSDKNLILEKMYNFPLKIIKSKYKNVCYQRNRGVDFAKYNTLLFLDADTTVENNYLEKYVFS